MTSYDLNEIFVDNLTDIMKSERISKAELSRRTGLAETHVTGILNKENKLSLSTVQRITKALGKGRLELFE